MTDTEEPKPGDTVRKLVREAERATLASTLARDGASALARDGSGRPYASLVLSACGHDGSPVLLLSDLADHSKNLAVAPQAALMFDGTAGHDDPLTGPRASLLGELRPVADPALAAGLRARYLARHPSAEMYIGFADFQLYRMAVVDAHLVAGFGSIHWLAGREVLFDTAGFEALAEAEAAIIAHMNADHREALEAIATRILGLSQPAVSGGWAMTGIDPEGFDLRAGALLARATFETPLRDAAAARAALVSLARKARDLPPNSP